MRWVLVWLIAPALALSVAAAARQAGARASEAPDPASAFVTSPWVVFVGSSLTARAVPPRFDIARFAPWAPPDAVALRRTRWGRHPQWLVRAAIAGVEAGARVVVLQADVLFVDQLPAEPLRTAWRSAVALTRRGIEVWLGRRASGPPPIREEDPDWPRFHRRWDGTELDGEPTLSVRPAHVSDDLRKLATRARQRGAIVVLTTMPRARSAMDRLPVGVLDAQIRGADAVASELGFERWTPARAWPDRYYYDRAHLNEEGRARFMAALKSLPIGAPPGS